MIALFQILLPTELLVLPGQQLAIVTVTTDTELLGVAEYDVIVHPPYRSQHPAIIGPGGPLIGDLNNFNPADPQPLAEDVVIDSHPAVRCDAIAVEIRAPEFDRSLEPFPASIRPLLDLACEAANELLQRIRVLTGAPHLRPLEPDSVRFRVVFLDDDRNRLPREEGKVVETGTSAWGRIANVAVTEDVWLKVIGLGDYAVPPWEQLLLDAQDFDAEPGPSLVLAATAVETRIANALDVLAKDKIPGDLWTWISERGGDYTKTPSVADQLDVLLSLLGGRSLKDDERLWAAGVHLRDARNSFVHRGRPVIGKTDQAVTGEKARELVARVREIIDFIEALLPEEERRPTVEPLPTVTATISFGGPGRNGGSEVEPQHEDE